MITESQETITIFRDARGTVKGFILGEPEQYGSRTTFTSYKHCGGGQPFAWLREDTDGAKVLTELREELGL